MSSEKNDAGSGLHNQTSTPRTLSFSNQSNEGVLLVPGSKIKEPQMIWSKVIFVCMVLLITMGLTNLYSAASGTSLFWSQFRNLGLALGAFAVFGWLVPTKWLNTYCYWFFGFICILLVIVDLTGSIAGGSQRWIRIGSFAFQPSEFAKISVAIVVAKFFYTSKLPRPYTLKDLLPLGIIIGVIFILIFAQPDLGTAGVCVIIAALQLSFVRIDLRSLSIVSVSGFVLGIFGWFFFLHDYQKNRVLNLLNPDMDPRKTGYNAIQSLVAIGSGQFLGKGYLQGTQNQLQFLPARHTDFIFSVFSEEHGFLGATVLFSLFALIIYSGLLIAKQARDTFASLLAVGCASIIFVSFAINTSMVLGLFPVVGVPLPFFSHGGTAMIMFCACLGILVGIERDSLGLFRRGNPFGVSRKSANSKVAKQA
ncbi:MAG: rod shape-determining protein RodA [Proteobacteria bacterium]|nr:rod shape-determining protein RodA [Pseudomonadota bacterium]